ncbi:MAG: metal-dependent hydrolase [Vicinamibacterales bacterium]
MDPISHLACGRTLIALVRREAATRGAVGAAVLGSVAPDVDAGFVPFGWDRYLRAHEIGTHSLLGALACAVLTAAVIRPARRDAPFLRLVTAAAIGTFSHLTLDVISGARLRLFWPIADPHVSLPLVAMADPVLLSLLVLAVILLAVVGPQRQRIAAGIALAAVALFLTVKGVLALNAVQAYESARPPDAVDARVIEAAWGTLREWTVFDRTGDEVRAWRVTAGVPGADLLLHWPRPRIDGVVSASTAWPTVRNFQRPHDLQLVTVAARSSGHLTVLWSDVRFCWDANTRPTSGDQPILLAGDGRRLACGLWFGGEVDADGRLVRQIVRVGTWVHARP